MINSEAIDNSYVVWGKKILPGWLGNLSNHEQYDPFLKTSFYLVISVEQHEQAKQQNRYLQADTLDTIIKKIQTSRYSKDLLIKENSALSVLNNKGDNSVLFGKDAIFLLEKKKEAKSKVLIQRSVQLTKDGFKQPNGKIIAYPIDFRVQTIEQFERMTEAEQLNLLWTSKSHQTSRIIFCRDQSSYQENNSLQNFIKFTAVYFDNQSQSQQFINFLFLRKFENNSVKKRSKLQKLSTYHYQQMLNRSSIKLEQLIGNYHNKIPDKRRGMMKFLKSIDATSLDNLISTFHELTFEKFEQHKEDQKKLEQQLQRQRELKQREHQRNEQIMKSKCLNEFHTRILEEYVKYMTDSLKAITLQRAEEEKLKIIEQEKQYQIFLEQEYKEYRRAIREYNENDPKVPKSSLITIAHKEDEENIKKFLYGIQLMEDWILADKHLALMDQIILFQKPFTARLAFWKIFLNYPVVKQHFKPRGEIDLKKLKQINMKIRQYTQNSQEIAQQQGFDVKWTDKDLKTVGDILKASCTFQPFLTTFGDIEIILKLLEQYKIADKDLNEIVYVYHSMRESVLTLFENQQGKFPSIKTIYIVMFIIRYYLDRTSKDQQLIETLFTRNNSLYTRFPKYLYGLFSAPQSTDICLHFWDFLFYQNFKQNFTQQTDYVYLSNLILAFSAFGISLFQLSKVLYATNYKEFDQSIRKFFSYDIRPNSFMQHVARIYEQLERNKPEFEAQIKRYSERYNEKMGFKEEVQNGASPQSLSKNNSIIEPHSSPNFLETKKIELDPIKLEQAQIKNKQIVFSIRKISIQQRIFTNLFLQVTYGKLESYLFGIEGAQKDINKTFRFDYTEDFDQIKISVYQNQADFREKVQELSKIKQLVINILDYEQNKIVREFEIFQDLILPDPSNQIFLSVEFNFLLLNI